MYWPTDMAACSSETCPEGANCERRWGGVLAKREQRVRQVWLSPDSEPCPEMVPVKPESCSTCHGTGKVTGTTVVPDHRGVQRYEEEDICPDCVDLRTLKSKEDK